MKSFLSAPRSQRSQDHLTSEIPLNTTTRSRRPAAFPLLLAVVLIATIWSAIDAADYATWFFELIVGALGILLLVLTRSRFQFSALVYLVVAIHYVILACGAKYTYAEMPLFEWLKDAMGLSRNHFDRVGHFAQGFTPALVVRELLMRQTPLRTAWMRNAISISAALSFSAAYEILEWLWVIIFYPDTGPEWLGMQGDPWDAQADMLMAFLGGSTAILFWGRIQDRQMGKLGAEFQDE